MIYDFFLLLQNPHTRDRARRHWAIFTLLTTLGWMAAGLTGLPVGRVVLVEGSAGVIFEVALSMSLLGILTGGLTGVGQWLYLRRRFSGAFWWLPASALGWGLGLPAALLANLLAGLGLSVALYGLVIGASCALFQSLFCRAIVLKPGRWLWANLLALPLGVAGAGWLDRALLIVTDGRWGLARWETALSAGIAGLIVGLLTGIALVEMTFAASEDGG